MNKTKFLIHPGLGKTATSFLQGFIFPEMHSRGIINYLNISIPNLEKYIIKRINYAEVYSEYDENLIDESFSEELLAILKKSKCPVILSFEGLIGLDPGMWSKRIFLIKSLFGGIEKDTTILLTFRDPISYMQSVFQQHIQQGEPFLKTDRYFLNKKNYNLALTHLGISASSRRVFSIDDLNFENLAKQFNCLFPIVYNIDMKEVTKLDFLEKLSICSRSEINSILNKINCSKRNTKINVSFSVIAMKLTDIREKFLKFFDLYSAGCYMKDGEKNLFDVIEISDKEMIKSLWKEFSNRKENRKIYFLNRIKIIWFLKKGIGLIDFLITHRRWRFLMQFYINRIFYQKWHSNFLYSLKHTQLENIKFIEKLPILFVKGKN